MSCNAESAVASLESTGVPSDSIPPKASSVPLYDTIFNSTLHLRAIPLTLEEQRFFLTHISQLQDYELFYILVRKFQLEHTGTDSQKRATKPGSLPYGSKQLKKGLKLHLNDLPMHLQQMLLHFLKMVLEVSASSGRVER